MRQNFPLLVNQRRCAKGAGIPTSERVMKFKGLTGLTGIENGIDRCSVNFSARHLAACSQVKLISSKEAPLNRNAALQPGNPSWRVFCVEGF